MIAGGLSSAAMEYGNGYVELREQGFSHEEANDKAAVKAGVIGLLDAASLKSAGKIAEKIFGGTKQAFKETAKDLAKEIPKQAGLGAAGEGFGSYFSNQPVNPRAVIEEALGEVVSAPGDAMATYQNKRALQENQEVKAPTPTGQPSTNEPIVSTQKINIGGKESTKVTRKDGSVEVDGVQVTPPEGVNTVNPQVQQLIDSGLVDENDLEEVQGLLNPNVPVAKSPEIKKPLINKIENDPAIEAEALDLANKFEATGQAGFANSMRAAINNMGGFNTPEKLDFYKQKLNEFEQQVGKAPENPQEKYDLTMFLGEGENAERKSDTKRYQKLLNKGSDDVKGVINASNENIQKLTDQINSLGFKVDDVNTSSPQEVQELKKKISQIGGSTLSYLRNAQHVEKDNKFANPEKVERIKNTLENDFEEVNQLVGEKLTEELPKRSSAENIPTLGMDDQVDSSDPEVLKNVNNILKDYKPESGRSVEGNYLDAVTKDLRRISESFESPPIDKNRSIPTAKIEIAPFNRGYVAGSSYTGKNGGYSRGLSSTGTVYETRLDAIEAEKANIRQQAAQENNITALKWLDSLPTDATKPQPKTQAQINQERQQAQREATGNVPAVTPVETAPEAVKPVVSANKIFTEDAATKARNRIRAKLNQLNSGIDPEFLIDGITMSGYHVEKGARTFAAYTKAMIDDFGDKVIPYLKQWYTALRLEPTAQDLAKEMDDNDTVMSYSFDKPNNVFDPDTKFDIAKKISEHFMLGQGFKSIVEARKFISDITGQKIEPGTPQAKEADEAIEVGVVLAARKIVEAGEKNGNTPSEIYSNLVFLYGKQPNLAVRSSTSVREQAYSTPAPLAYVASQLAGINEDTTVYEPTAGNGMLLIGTDQKNVYANELNASRYEMLKRIMPDAIVSNQNALDVDNKSLLELKVNTVIENPPFGSTGENFDVDGFKTREIDHAIVMKSLNNMKDNGRAVLIVGGVRADGDEARKEGYRSAAKRNFYVNLYKDYNVVDHFSVAGDMYSKQGASFPVDVIVINGKGQSQRSLPAAQLPQMINNYEELRGKLNEPSMATEGNIGTSGANVSEPTSRTSEPERLGERPSGQGNEPSAKRAESTGVSGQGLSKNEPAKRGQSKPTGTSVSEGQPKSTNVSKSANDGRSVSSTTEREQPRSGESVTGNEPRGLGEPSVVAGTKVESGLKDRRGQETETGHQVGYEPHSQGSSVGTLVPKAMAQSIDESLNKIEQETGNIDEYVAEALNMDPGTLVEKFSAEQIDALALAVRNAEAGKGFIIGDQTGIGKGRVVAAMIKYAILNDKTPIFVTEKPNLYSDMIRDLDDIGMTKELGLDTAKPKIFMTNGDQAVPYTLLRKVGNEITENNLILKAPAKGDKLNDMMKDFGNKESLGDYKVIFTTYSQLQTVKGKATERQAFINNFGTDGYLIFDESHNAGGANNKGKGEDSDEVKGRAGFVRELVNNAFGTFFSSATYAKRPEVMDLYSSTDMKLAVDNIKDLADAIKNGGIPMQQIVANMLTKVGQYIRRERTFAGVSYNTVETKVDKDTAENMATSMRDILAFSRAKEKTVKGLQKELDQRGSIARGSSEKAQVQSANFGSIMHNLIDQMLLSLKAQDSISHAVESLKRDEQVVLTVSNTMGSFLQSYADEMGLNTGDPVKLTFKDLYLKYLEKQRIVKIKQPGQKEGQEYRLTDQDLGPELTEQFNKIRDFINNAGFGSAPISPIDYMHSELRKLGYVTEEITGRTVTLNYESGTPILTSRSANIKQRVNAVRAFNNGDARVIILNQAGSTGLSLHASDKFKNKNKRHMIIVQPEKNVDTHMQMLGRVHRTGQIIPPAYSQMMADIPAEMRPAAVLLKKMASLNANTTASRKSAVTAEGAVDFMNEYGGQIAQEYLRDNPEIHEALGGKKIVEISDDPNEATEEDIRKFTGYIPILPIKQQEEIYKDLIERYNDLIERENSMGTNKLEAKAVDLDAETLSSTPITESKGDSLFAQPAFMERVDVKRTVKPYSKAEIEEQITKNLKGNTAKEVAQDFRKLLYEKYEVFYKQREEELKESDFDDVKKQATLNQLKLNQSHIDTILRAYPIGTSISVKNNQGVFVYGVITNIETKGKTKNPAAGSDWKMTIALANGDAKSLPLTFSQIGSIYQLSQENIVNWLNPETGVAENIHVRDIFDKGGNVRREKRWMVTGNILSGFASPAVGNQGQIISYTKNDGTTGQGVLMPRTYDFEKSQRDAPIKIKSAEDAIRFMEEANGSVGTPDQMLQITKNGRRIQFNVPSSKKTGGVYFLDSKLTRLIGDFYKSGKTMYAYTFDEDVAKKAIDYLLNTKGETLIALNQKEKARQMFEPSIPTNNIPTNNISFGEVSITPKRLKNLLSTYAYTMDDSRTKAYITYISPDQFLKATSSETRETEIIKEAGKLRPSELENEIQPIYLTLKKAENFDFYNIVGHEGRHRMAALRKAGITKVPVILEFRSSIDDAQPIKKYEFIARQYDVNGRDGFSLQDEALPINYKYKKQILEKYGNEQAEYTYNINFKPNEKIKEYRKRIRDEQIAEYQKLRQRSAHIMKKVAKGEMNLDYQRELTRLMEASTELKQDIKMSSPKNDTPEHFMKKALEEFTKGNISQDTLNVIKYVYDKTPALLGGIKLSVRKDQTGNAIGNYNTLERLVTLYKGTGTEDPVTIRHELMHTLENMMTPQTREAIVESWQNALSAAIKKNTDAVHAKYLSAVLDFVEKPSREAFDKAASLCPNMEMYQYINPSEYWAVNAEKLFGTKMGTPWHRFVQFTKQLFEGLKSVLGFNSQYPIYKAFNDLMKGQTPRDHKIMLVDYVTKGNIKLDFINNIKETEEILKDRPPARMALSESTYDRLLGGMKEATRIGENVLLNPKQGVINMVGNVDRVVLAARIKASDFTAGLTAADAARYGRMLVDSAGRAIASVAMNQALRATRIGTQVIVRGKLFFNPVTQMFEALEDKNSVANILKLKHDLEDRIGKALAYKAIQAYFEAKRSRSIVDEYLKREGEVEDLRTEQMDPATSPERQLTLLNKIADAEQDLRNIKIALDKVNMNDEEIDKYSALEKIHPELRGMMDNWNAVNKNMIDNMEISKIISKERAKTLRGIEDYVPWNRIMDDQEDVHSPSFFRPATPKYQYGAKAVRNVSREQKFKEGEVDLEIDDIVDNMIHNVMVTSRNVIKNYAANRIAQEYGVRNERGQLKVFPQEDHSRGIVKILVNGRKVNIQIADPLIAQAAIGIESVQIPMGQILSFFANGLRRTVTISPAFQAKQVFMDAPTAILVTGVKNPLALWTKVFTSSIKALKKNDPVIEILKAHGIGGFTSTARTAEQEFKQEIGLINQSYYAQATKLLDRIGDASDYSQRRAVFIRKIIESGGKIVNGKVEGGDQRAAILAATNVIDWEKRGNSATAQFLNRTISFMNAFAQQIDVLTQALMEVPAAGIEKLTGAKISSVSGNLKGLSRQQAINRLTIAGMGLSTAVLLYCFAIGDDDEYNKMDDQTKMRNFIIPRKLMKEIGYDHTLLIPMHTSASYLFKSIPEMLFNQITKEGTKDAVDNARLRKALHEGLIDAFAGPLGSGPVPTGLKPLAEIKLNYNFFNGGKITPRSMENLAAFEQYNAATSELGKMLSSLTGDKEKRLLNPMEADHLMRGLGGSVAATAMWMSNALGNNRPTPEERNNPLYGSFVAPEIPRGREDLFYDLKQRTEVAMGTYTDLMKHQDKTEAKEWYKDHINEIKAYGFTQQAGKDIADINAEIRRIEKLPVEKMGSEEKRRRINEFKLTKERILEQTIKFRVRAEQKPSP
jgi:predicted RNA methylase